MSEINHELPTLSLSEGLASAGSRKQFLEKLRETSRGLGFFYLKDHGIPAELIDDVRQLSKRFFALPEKDKLQIQMVNSPYFRGYNRAGLEHTRGLPDWREQVDIGPEQQALPLLPGAPTWQRLIGPNQWPSALPELKPVILRYQDAVTRLGIQLTELLAESLGQNKDVFAPVYTPAPNQLIKIIRYPGVQPRKANRVSALTRIRASSPFYCRMSSADSRSKARMAGSLHRRCRAHSSSTLENCLRWLQEGTCAPTFIVSSLRHLTLTGYPLPSFSVLS